jgi:hypothetical protein
MDGCITAATTREMIQDALLVACIMVSASTSYYVLSVVLNFMQKRARDSTVFWLGSLLVFVVATIFPAAVVILFSLFTTLPHGR